MVITFSIDKLSKEKIGLNKMLSRVIISTIKTVSKLLAIHIALIWEMANKLNEGEGLELRSTDNPGGPKGSLKPFKKSGPTHTFW